MSVYDFSKNVKIEITIQSLFPDIVARYLLENFSGYNIATTIHNTENTTNFTIVHDEPMRLQQCGQIHLQEKLAETFTQYTFIESIKIEISDVDKIVIRLEGYYEDGRNNTIEIRAQNNTWQLFFADEDEKHCMLMVLPLEFDTDEKRPNEEDFIILYYDKSNVEHMKEFHEITKDVCAQID